MERVGIGAAARAALGALDGGPAVAVISTVDPDRGGARVLVHEGDRVEGSLGGSTDLDRAAVELGRSLLAGRTESPTTSRTTDSALLYGELHRAPARLVVVGAGHIAVPLARLGVLLGYPVTVLDDRETFATGERFPEEATVRRVDFSAPFEGLSWRGDDAVILVTRAHRYDYDCLRRLLDSDPRPGYIGMVGSRRRVRAAFRALVDAGTPSSALRDIHAPIGVDIGAETPEEIAVSIAAELVAHRRGVAAAGSLRDRESVVARFLG